MVKTRCRFTGYTCELVYDVCPTCKTIMGCYSKEGGYVECAMCPDEGKLREVSKYIRNIEAPFECVRCITN